MKQSQARPLQNPKATDFAPLTTSEQQELLDAEQIEQDWRQLLQASVSKQQLPLRVGGRWDMITNRYRRFKAAISRRETEIELTPYWQELAPAIAIITTVFVVAGPAIAGLMFFSKIQPRIPFYYNAFTGYWEQVDKSVLVLLPVLFFVLLTIILRFNYDVYRFDPRLSRVLNYILGMVNLLFLLALTQIYSLVLPS